MSTNEQSITENEKYLRQQKGVFCKNFNDFLQWFKEEHPTTEKQKQLWIIYQEGVAHYNECEQSIPENFVLGASRSIQWISTKAESIFNTLDSLLSFYSAMKVAFTSLDIEVPPISPMAFATMQRFIKQYYPQQAAEIREKFVSAGLPIFGFDNPLVAHEPPGAATLKLDSAGTAEATNLKSEDVREVLLKRASVTASAEHIVAVGPLASSDMVAIAKEAQALAKPTKPTPKQVVKNEAWASLVKVPVGLLTFLLVGLLGYWLSGVGCRPFQKSPVPASATRDM